LFDRNLIRSDILKATLTWMLMFSTEIVNSLFVDSQR